MEEPCLSAEAAVKQDTQLLYLVQFNPECTLYE